MIQSRKMAKKLTNSRLNLATLVAAAAFAGAGCTDHSGIANRDINDDGKKDYVVTENKDNTLDFVFTAEPGAVSGSSYIDLSDGKLWMGDTPYTHVIIADEFNLGRGAEITTARGDFTWNDNKVYFDSNGDFLSEGDPEQEILYLVPTEKGHELGVLFYSNLPEDGESNQYRFKTLASFDEKPKFRVETETRSTGPSMDMVTGEHDISKLYVEGGQR